VYFLENVALFPESTAEAQNVLETAVYSGWTEPPDFETQLLVLNESGLLEEVSNSQQCITQKNKIARRHGCIGEI
jgi:hypothetical protein